MQIHICKNPDELSISVADWMVEYIAATLEKKRRFTIALSGGSTPQKLHTVLSSSPYKEKINWEQLHVFWGDERAVPFEDDRNNAKMGYDTLLNHVPVPASQIHVMRTDISPEDSAREYEAILHNYFDGEPASFDLVLLGMGDDGHTLSLFPGTAIVHEQNAWTKAYYLQAQEMYRITITAPIVNRSSAVAFLAVGAKKSAALSEVLNGAFNPDVYPSQIIRPLNGELHWFVDQAAAAQLK